MRRLESAQGKLIKQSLGLSQLSHNTALLNALNIEKIEDIVNINVLSLYYSVAVIDSGIWRSNRACKHRACPYNDVQTSDFTCEDAKTLKTMCRGTFRED